MYRLFTWPKYATPLLTPMLFLIDGRGSCDARASEGRWCYHCQRARVLPGRGTLAPRVCRRSRHVSRGTGAVVARRTLARVLAAARAARAHATHPPTATKTVAAVWAVVVVVARTRRRVAQLWREREHGSLCRTLVGSRTHLLLSFIAIGLLHAACTKVLARSLSTTHLDERRPV